MISRAERGISLLYENFTKPFNSYAAIGISKLVIPLGHKEKDGGEVGSLWQRRLCRFGF